MVTTSSEFLEQYGAALRRGTAALFLGAGASADAGFPTWRTLLEKSARQLGLAIDDRTDLVELAQFVFNERRRPTLDQLIVSAFDRPRRRPELHDMIAQLPFNSIWTTNYDTLIEDAFIKADVHLDVKRDNDSLARHDHRALTVLYKMHGCVTDPSHCVLMKDDFELYAQGRPGFLHLLSADYISKTFLFLGLSFRDPNVNYILATIRAVFRGGGPTHFAVMQRPQVVGNERTRFDYWVADMHRYGMNVLAVDSYEEISDLLSTLQKNYRGERARDSVYVNGSFEQVSPHREKIEELCRRIGCLLARNGKRLVSGLGIIVGPSTLRGFIETLDEDHKPTYGRLWLRPVRSKHPEALKRRRALMEEAKTWVLIGGTDGTREDAVVASSLEGQLVPIPGTGGTADEVVEELLTDPDVTELQRALLLKLREADFSLERGDHDDVDAVIRVLEEHFAAST
ncbi:MAG: SIR2 family protein [Candidatus Eremiobacteraeota bacterium]|nr:SIR2 family protein [Candidatus Eremiobacteraeota bacterium]